MDHGSSAGICTCDRKPPVTKELKPPKTDGGIEQKMFIVVNVATVRGLDHSLTCITASNTWRLSTMYGSRSQLPFDNAYPSH